MLRLAANLKLPLDFATERIAYLARTGAGKSGGMRVMFEQMFDAGLFSIFVDPKGDAWGIRGDGTGKGRKVLVIGGDHGDIPIEPTAGKVIAEFLVKERVSTVVDISDFSTPKMWRFMADFTQMLYKLNREVLHLFIDEVDMIAGQNYFDPECLHGIQLIQNKGRGRGFGLTIATQRPQIVNKTVLNASGTYIVMQILGDDALKVVKSCLAQTASKETTQEILSEIPTFQPRDAFVYSPQTLGLEPRRITFDSFETFDSMRTPKPGERRQTPKSLADIDLGAVKRDMAATIEKAKADDPAVLRKKIATLEADLKKAQKTIPQTVAAAATRVETKEIQVKVPVPVLDEAKLGELETAIDQYTDTLLSNVNNVVTAVTAAAKDLRAVDRQPITRLLRDLRKAKPMLPAGLKLPAVPVKSSSAPSQPVKTATPSGPTSPIPANRPPREAVEAPSEIGEKQQEMLDTLLTFEQLGRSSVEKGVIAAFIGVKASGSTVRKYWGILSNAELVSYPEPGTVSLTDAGRAAARATAEIKGLEDLHDAWRRLIGSEKMIEILDLVIGAHPDPIGRQWVADQIGVDIKGSTMRKYLGTLRGYDVIDYVTVDGDACLKATGLLFPEGLY